MQSGGIRVCAGPPLAAQALKLALAGVHRLVCAVGDTGTSEGDPAPSNTAAIPADTDATPSDTAAPEQGTPQITMGDASELALDLAPGESQDFEIHGNLLPVGCTMAVISDYDVMAVAPTFEGGDEA